MLSNDKAFFLVGDSLSFLLAVLNSRMAAWWVRNTGVPTGMGVIQWDKFVVEKIPIPAVGELEQRELVRLVDQILAAKDANPDEDVSDLEAQIDRQVYDLYGLTEAEVRAVEGALA